MKASDSAAFAYALPGKLCRVGLKGRTSQSWFASRPLTLMRKAISNDRLDEDLFGPTNATVSA
jgi:hypothetical protein